jgi:hypothetical protein
VPATVNPTTGVGEQGISTITAREKASLPADPA